jgi:CBS domain-containing protein
MGAIETILETKEPCVYAIEPSATVMAAVQRMCSARVGALLVMDGPVLRGIFSERDLMTRVILSHRDPARARVEDVMTQKALCVGLGVSHDDALALMLNRHVRHLPVVKDSGIVGVISLGDLIRDTLRTREREVEDLREYVSGHYPG